MEEKDSREKEEVVSSFSKDECDSYTAYVLSSNLVVIYRITVILENTFVAHDFRLSNFK